MCGILAVLGFIDNSQEWIALPLTLLSCSSTFGDCDPASGDQPLYSEDKTVIVTVNGEIYNHKQLRENLKSHQFRTGSDCEVIAHLYEEHGEEFVDMLDGMFSLVLLDTRDQSFIAARDAIGSIWFASEMKALSDDCERFISFPHGHIYSSKQGEIRRWYNPPWFLEQTPSASYDPLVLRKAFEKAVVKRLMIDVPFGVLLSGGLNSSLVAAVASRYLADSEAACQWGSQLHTFCIGLESSPDLKAAREVADYLGTRHHAFHFTVQEGIDALEEVIYHIETYDVMTIRASTPMFLMSRKIKSLGVKMVISGARVPFLDKEFINIAMNIDPEWKWYSTYTHILYRQKEQFSDGVGYSWIDGLEDHANSQVTDSMLINASFIYPENTPTTKEAYYYRTIFDKFFPKNAARSTVPGSPSVACSTAKAVEWDAEWLKNPDPSGRAALGNHAAAYEEAAGNASNGNVLGGSQKVQEGIVAKAAAVV
ncbi:unnamed protein product [Malus baccata var. baccata]